MAARWLRAAAIAAVVGGCLALLRWALKRRRALSLPRYRLFVLTRDNEAMWDKSRRLRDTEEREFPPPSSDNELYLVVAVPMATGAVDRLASASTEEGEIVGTAIVSGPVTNFGPKLLRMLRRGLPLEVVLKHAAVVSDASPTVARLLANPDASETAVVVPGKRPRSATLFDVMVTPSHRGTGLGTALVRAAAIVAAAHGFDTVDGVAAETSLVAWYRSILGPSLQHEASVMQGSRSFFVNLSPPVLASCRRMLAERFHLDTRVPEPDNA